MRLSTLFPTAVAILISLCPCRGQQLDPSGEPSSPNVNWRGLLLQSGLFLGIEHGFRFATEPGTRAEIKGRFFHDWGGAIRGLGGWRDSDPFLVNYIGHPLQGAVTGHIFTQNYRPGRMTEFGFNRQYWSSRLKAMAWSTAYSVQFELGPVSEASLGNVGSAALPGTMGYVDLIVTPTAGMGVQVLEDALDHFVVRPLEKRFSWQPAVIAMRGILNPARSFANALRWKVPWHRDTRPGVRSLSTRTEVQRSGVAVD
jgi:hypothetical protein